VGDPVVCIENLYRPFDSKEAKLLAELGESASKKDREPDEDALALDPALLRELEEDDDEEKKLAQGAEKSTDVLMVANGTRGRALFENGKYFVRYSTVAPNGFTVEWDDVLTRHPDSLFPRYQSKFKALYCSTVNKFQGFQQDEIVAVLHLGQHDPHVKRAHLLVAASRAMKRLVLLTDYQTLSKMTRDMPPMVDSFMKRAFQEFKEMKKRAREDTSQ